MRFRGKVDHMRNIVVRKDRVHLRPVANIRAHKAIVLILRNIAEALKIARIRQRVRVDEQVFRRVLSHPANEVAADEPRPSGHENPHYFPSLASASRYCPYSVILSSSPSSLSCSVVINPRRQAISSMQEM
ncbi:hypothetical protein SDC9_83172 [bioreactor metagenome]|uniref:Uncharacterized protein n=1 Tax=bioreactor metagenome TaxID=1076179 RepID=A0A644ZCY4_9ZZZZ